MPEDVIICPHCKKEIPLTEAITHQIREKLIKEFEAESKSKEQELEKREQALSIREKETERAEKMIEEEIDKKLKLERKKLEKELKQKAEESIAKELKDLYEQIKEKDKKLQKAQEEELKLRKERRELEESKKSFELEMQRKLDEERKSIMEKHRLEVLDKKKQIDDMRKQIEELKRKAEQGSYQIQGEVLEIELEDILKANFPIDNIEPVPKGIKGADVLQKVYNQSGQYCGAIIWESKRTKAWRDGWIPKLKEDQRAVKAEIAVLMTTLLPKDVTNFAYIEGIWVTNYNSMIGLTNALRMNLIQVANTKLSTIGKNKKKEVLYNYLSGPEFRQKVEAIVEAFIFMKKDLDKEKRAMMRIWSKREKQIESVIRNTAGMYGDMQGIIGASLPQIKSLELKALTSKTDSEELSYNGDKEDI